MLPHRTRSARRAARCPPTPTTASRRRAPSRTSPSAACARPPTSSPPRSSSRRPPPRPTRRSAGSTATVADAIVAAADEILAGGSARSVRRRRVSGRRRHVAQHERERGARQPRRRAARRAARHLHARAPERSRQHGPVDQRRVSRRRRGWRCCSARRRSSPRRARSPTSFAQQGRRRSRDVLKTGRTHLQDAVPMTLGQEFGGYAACVAPRRRRRRARPPTQLRELNLGATAVGTGLNAGDDYTAPASSRHLARDTGLPLVPAANLFRVTQSMGDVLAYSGAMRRLAVELGEDRERSAAAEHGAARGARRRSRCRPCSRARRSCRAR